MKRYAGYTGFCFLESTEENKDLQRISGGLCGGVEGIEALC